jgi:hypothetical protein
VNREQVYVAVPDSLEDREAVVAKLEAVGVVAVTPSELEAMQQPTLAIGHSRLVTVAALTALAGLAGGGMPSPRTSIDRRAAHRSYSGSGQDQAERIAKAQAKRERKASLRSPNQRKTND